MNREARKTFSTFVEYDEDTETPAPPMGLISTSPDFARTMYFALCEYRDVILKDIARYDDFGAKYYQECDEHPMNTFDNYDPFCNRCVEVKTLRDKGHKLEKLRDEDLMFLGETLSNVTTMLFYMGEGNKDFDEWLGM